MPIAPSDTLQRRQAPEIATGRVVTTSQKYAVGQNVSVTIQGGNLSSAQIIGGAAGSAPRIKQVVV